MGTYKPCKAPIQKGERLFNDQSPRNDDEIAKMENVLYASIVGSLMYAQVCTCPNIAFVITWCGSLAGYKTSYEIPIGYKRLHAHLQKSKLS